MNDERKLEALQQATGLDVTALGAAKKAEAEAEGRESKEVKDEATPEPVAETAPEPAASGGIGITAETIGLALAEAMTPILVRLEALESKALAPVEEPVTPFDAIMHSYESRVIGSDDAKVDGRTKEARDAPQERLDGFPAKVNNDGFAAHSINRIFGGQLAKELAGFQGGESE